MQKKYLQSAPHLDLESFTKLLEDAHVGVVVASHAKALIHLNKAAAAMFDYTNIELAFKQPHLCERWQHDKPFTERVLHAVERQGCWTGEIALRRNDGLLYRHTLSLLAIRDEIGHIVNYLGLINDDTQQTAIAEQVRNIAHFDALTGLPNRLLLNDRLEQAIANNRRAGTQLAVCFMDLDGFKHINDTLGHAAGDSLLKFVASRLLNSLRESDTVARLGGDEFVMLLSGLNSEDECRMTLSRLLKEIAEPYTLEEQHIAEISLSIGVAMYTNEGGTADTLLRQADHAMYAAKKAGKNRFQMFDNRLEERMQARQQMLRRVNKALQNGQFSLHYLPTVDFAQSRVTAMEGLLRWNHPILGNLSPAEFVPLVEDDELSSELGAWVIEAALRQALVWHQQGIDLPVSVNTFSRHLLSRDFPKMLQQIIAEVWPDMPEGRLRLEVIESNRSNAVARLQESILACRRHGIHFSLDDFGIGESSLNSLRLLSIDEIKIYQSFPQEIASNPSARPIIRGILELGHAFGLQVVAEGVDTHERIVQLRQLGCHVMQGYGIAKPMPADQVPEWLATFNPAAYPEAP